MVLMNCEWRFLHISLETKVFQFMFHLQTTEKLYTYGETSIGANGRIEKNIVNEGWNTSFTKFYWFHGHLRRLWKIEGWFSNFFLADSHQALLIYELFSVPFSIVKETIMLLKWLDIRNGSYLWFWWQCEIFIAEVKNVNFLYCIDYQYYTGWCKLLKIINPRFPWQTCDYFIYL